MSNREEISAEAFCKMYKEAVKTLFISDRQAAEYFSVDRTTHKKWQNGKSAPTPGYRRMVADTIRRMKEDAR